MDYKKLANSTEMCALVALVILVVTVQAFLFIRKAYKRGQELGMEKSTLKRAMTNSAILSIVPSLPIIVMMLALSVPLGKYFPWLRLSVVGSAMYEGTAANVAVQTMGLIDISDPNITPKIFVIVMFVMTTGIIWGILFNIFFMKHLDQFSKKMKEKPHTAGFIKYFSAALFSAMILTLSAPYVANVKNFSSIVAFLAAGATTLICNKIAKVTNKSIISDFSMPIALILGMAAVIVQVNLF